MVTKPYCGLLAAKTAVRPATATDAVRLKIAGEIALTLGAD
jgi:hypothetical protein